MHVANGMYGLILVEPPEGLPPVDREYYVMQGEFYTAGKYGEKGLQPFDMEKAIDENADLRRVQRRRRARSSATSALQAKVGESVRLFVGNGGPNLVVELPRHRRDLRPASTPRAARASRRTCRRRSCPPAARRSWSSRSKCPALHPRRPLALPRVQQGRARHAQGRGPRATDRLLRQGDRLRVPGDKAAPATLVSAATTTASIDGARIAQAGVCFRHVFHVSPARRQRHPKRLSAACTIRFLKADPKRAIGIALNGFCGPIMVNGQTFNSVMPPMRQLNDDEIANILTFVLSEWGNPEA